MQFHEYSIYSYNIALLSVTIFILVFRSSLKKHFPHCFHGKKFTGGCTFLLIGPFAKIPFAWRIALAVSVCGCPYAFRLYCCFRWPVSSPPFWFFLMNSKLCSALTSSLLTSCCRHCLLYPSLWLCLPKYFARIFYVLLDAVPFQIYTELPFRC